VCSSQTVAGALPGAEGPDDEGRTDQRLHLPPRGTHLLQAGTRQGSQAKTTFLLLAFSLFRLAFSLFLDLRLSSAWNPPRQSGKDNLPSSCLFFVSQSHTFFRLKPTKAVRQAQASSFLLLSIP